MEKHKFTLVYETYRMKIMNISKKENLENIFYSLKDKFAAAWISNLLFVQMLKNQSIFHWLPFNL